MLSSSQFELAENESIIYLRETVISHVILILSNTCTCIHLRLVIYLNRCEQKSQQKVCCHTMTIDFS